MRKADIRAKVASRLADLGYDQMHAGWVDRLAVCKVIVGWGARPHIIELYMPTKAKVEELERQLSKIPRRGPPRAMPMAARDDGGGIQEDFGTIWDRR
jgi:hypothetical protein